MAEPKPTTEEVLKLAREIRDYQLWGTIKPHDCRMVAQALIERLEPVKLLRPRECFSVECDACHEGEAFPSDNFRPNCGRLIQWM